MCAVLPEVFRSITWTRPESINVRSRSSRSRCFTCWNALVSSLFEMPLSPATRMRSAILSTSEPSRFIPVGKRSKIVFSASSAAENHEEKQNRRSVGVIQDRLVAGHELQLVEQPESVGQQDNDGEQQSVGNHVSPSLLATGLRDVWGSPPAVGTLGDPRRSALPLLSNPTPRRLKVRVA
jgi:hypothetical protein